MGCRCFFILLAAIVLGPMSHWPFRPRSSLDAAPERFYKSPRTSLEPTIFFPAADPQLPPYWEKHQINGLDYYIMPVSA